ncbi:MAG TPA: DNA polymerase IV [Planctomycetota bacterium]|nr:DNA polymerase IV [Planctomycetota bacterium]
MTTAPITILHVDMDAFYTAVEVRDNPSLADLPVCVGGGAHQRGVIASASYAARKFGVRSAMPTGQALSLCPQLVLVPPDFERYTRESRRIMEVFRSYTPLVEPLSLDEAFLDVAGCERLFGDAIEIGRAIKRDILRNTGLVASVGVAPTKFLAKLASDMDKPDGFRVIRPEEVRTLLDPLPVSAIFGVGPRTAKRLEALGVRTIGELAARPRDEVLARFGASGAWIHELAHGIDSRRVNPRREEKSYSVERTFEQDVSDREKLLLALLQFCEELGERLRDRGLRGRTISIKARYGNFKTVTRSFTLDFATNLGPRIYSAARGLFARTPPGALRLLGVQVSSLEDVRTPIQGDLFGSALTNTQGEPGTERLERATASIDKLRKKYGARTVVPASLLASSRMR